MKFKTLNLIFLYGRTDAHTDGQTSLKQYAPSFFQSLGHNNQKCDIAAADDTGDNDAVGDMIHIICVRHEQNRTDSLLT